MAHDDLSAFDAWIEEQVLAWLASGLDGQRLSPQEFAAQCAPPASNAERARALLVERLRILVRFETELAQPLDDSIRVGLDLPDFEILELVGRGGMGQVYRARQKSLGREVAIKVLHASATFDAQSRLRFMREAQAVAQTRHPGIVPLYQIGEHNGAPFLVFEFVRGRTLATIVREMRDGRVGREGAALGHAGEAYERAVALVAVEILDAVEAAHAIGVVHRDLKPGNVLVEPNGRARVLDFGLASFGDDSSITASRDVIGTPSYMAPETVKDAHASGPSSDVYSVGVLVYELLALEKPFEAESTPATLARIVSGDSTPLHVSRHAPRRLSAIVEKAMAREIDRRYSSARAFANDLRAFLAGADIEAKPSTWLSRLGRRMQRNPALTAAGVIAIACLALFAGEWRSGRAVLADNNQRRATKQTRAALLWEMTDADVAGDTFGRQSGRERAIAELQAAVSADRSARIARIELARLYMASGNRHSALRVIDELESEGASERAVTWIKNWALDPQKKRAAPDSHETIVDGNLCEIDALTWVRCLVASARPGSPERAMQILYALEDHEVLGPIAHYLQWQACNTRGVRDAARAARYLQGALAVVPDHPVLLANQMQALLDLWDKQSTNNTWADIVALLGRLDAARQSFPDVRIVWVNESSGLALLGQVDSARDLLEQAINRYPNDVWIVNRFAELQLDLWGHAMERHEPIPEAEIEALHRRLLRLGDGDFKTVLNLAQIGYVARNPDDVEMWGHCTEDAFTHRTIQQVKAKVAGLLQWAADQRGAEAPTSR